MRRSCSNSTAWSTSSRKRPKNPTAVTSRALSRARPSGTARSWRLPSEVCSLMPGPSTSGPQVSATSRSSASIRDMTSSVACGLLGIGERPAGQQVRRRRARPRYAGRAAPRVRPSSSSLPCRHLVTLLQMTCHEERAPQTTPPCPRGRCYAAGTARSRPGPPSRGVPQMRWTPLVAAALAALSLALVPVPRSGGRRRRHAAGDDLRRARRLAARVVRRPLQRRGRGVGRRRDLGGGRRRPGAPGGRSGRRSA